jgi:hypothetical protein
MTGYFENKSANNVEADPLMMVLRLADFKQRVNQGHFRADTKKPQLNE